MSESDSPTVEELAELLAEVEVRQSIELGTLTAWTDHVDAVQEVLRL